MFILFDGIFFVNFEPSGIFVKKQVLYSKEEKKQLNINFWTGFNLYCSRMQYLRGKQKKWILHRTGVNNVHLKFEPDNNGVKVILEIQHKNETVRLEMYEKIEQYKAILEDGIETEVIWDFAYVRDLGQKVCRIYTELKGVNIYRQSDWEEMYHFMAENMFRLENNFIDIRDILKS